MNASFSIDKTNIKELGDPLGVLSNGPSRVFTIYTKSPVKYRSIEQKHFEFQCTSGNCDSIASWLRDASRTQQTRKTRPSPPTTPPPKTFVAELKRSQGALVIWEKMITFKRHKDTSYLHQWDLKEIKNIERKDVYLLEVTPSDGGKYAFKLLDKSISLDEVNEIRSRMFKQRTVK